MSGETEASVSGWTTDTLREHLLQRLADQRDALRQQLSDQRDYFATQIAALSSSDSRHISDMREMLNERYATQTKALDAAFLAQQTAMRTALEAAEKAVATALTSAEKAVAKAEVAADKRFESVNEFRQQLSDQTSTFIPRAEYNSAHGNIAERISILNDRVAALELRLTSRLDRGEGETAGTAHQAVQTRDNRTLANSTAAVVMQALIGLVAVAALIVSVVLSVH